MRDPHWGATPGLLAEPDGDTERARLVELRAAAPRHLLECYRVSGLPVVRCTKSDELGFRHPAIDAATAALRGADAAIASLFAGSILEVLPTTVETAPGHRIAVASLVDIYRFDDADLRDEPFDTRRDLVERLAAALDSRAIVAAPLLRVRPARASHARAVTPTALRALAR